MSYSGGAYDWFNEDTSGDGGIGNPGPPPSDGGEASRPTDGGIGNAGPPPDNSAYDWFNRDTAVQETAPPSYDTTDTTTKRAQQALDGGIGNPGPPPADQMPTPAGQDNRSWWERGKDLLGSAAKEVGDLVGMGPMALKDTIDAGNRPWEDPGAFLKDAYGSAAGTVGNTIKDAFDVGSRIQGSAAVAANDLRRGNFGQFANDINPASNAYYSITGDQAPWMGDTEYTTRNVVSRNPAGAVLPGKGSGEGPQVVPDSVPIIGGDSIFDLPIVGGLARAGTDVFNSVRGGSVAQGPSIDVGALQNDIANGMSFQDAAAKYPGSVGSRILSDLINPVNFVEVPGLGEAVASIFETKTGRVLDEIAQQAKQAGGWTPELAAEGKQALAGSGNLFDLSKPNQVGQLTETQAGAISGLNRVSTAQDVAAILDEGAAKIAVGDTPTALQWATQFADQIGSTPEGVLDTMQRTANGMKYNLESRATTPVSPDSIARALDEKAQGIRDLGSDLKNVYVRESAAKLRVDLDRLTQQIMSPDPAVAARGLEAKQAVTALAARDIVKDDLRAGWYAEAGYKLPGTENQLTQGMQGLFSIVRGLMLAGSAPPLALQKFSDEWFRALTQGTVGIRASDTAIGQALARFTEKRNLLGQGERAQGFLNRGTVGNLVRNDILPPSAALADVNPLTFRGAFTGQNRYGEAIRPGERFQALASPVDKWNQSLIAAPTQHVVLNALYQDTRRLGRVTEQTAEMVYQSMIRNGYAPDHALWEYHRALDAKNPGDILRIGEQLPPVVPESGMAKGTAIPTARDLAARGKNLTPQVLQAIQESGGQPGLLREVSRPPAPVPANARGPKTFEEYAAKGGTPTGPAPATDVREWAQRVVDGEVPVMVPRDMRQQAADLGVTFMPTDTPQSFAQRVVDETAPQRPVGINRGTSAGAGTSQPLPKGAQSETDFRGFFSGPLPESPTTGAVNAQRNAEVQRVREYMAANPTATVDDVAQAIGRGKPWTSMAMDEVRAGGTPLNIAAENQRQIAALKEIAGEPTTPAATKLPTNREKATATAQAITAAGEDITAVSKADYVQMRSQQLRDRVKDYGTSSKSGNIERRARGVYASDKAGFEAMYDQAVAEKASAGASPTFDAAAGDGGLGYRGYPPAQQATMRRFGLDEPGDLTALEAGMGGQFDRTRFWRGQREGVTNDMVRGYRMGDYDTPAIVAQAREQGLRAIAEGDTAELQRVEDYLLNHGQAAVVGGDRNAYKAYHDLRAELLGESTLSPEARAARDQPLRAAQSQDWAYGEAAGQQEAPFYREGVIPSIGREGLPPIGNEGAPLQLPQGEVPLALPRGPLPTITEQLGPRVTRYRGDLEALAGEGGTMRPPLAGFSTAPETRLLPAGAPTPAMHGPEFVPPARAPFTDFTAGANGLIPGTPLNIPIRDVRVLEAARGRAQAGIREAAFARGTGDQAAVQAGLERGYRIVGNNADQTTAGMWMKNGVGGVTPPVLPFAPFHIHSAQFWAQYFASHPALALGMAQVLQNFDDYGTLKLSGGNTVAGLIKMTTGLHVLEWAQKAYEYAQDVNAQGGNNLLQQGLKNANYNLFGNNAFVRPFEYVSGPMASLTQRTTNPLLSGKLDYETKQPLVASADLLREYGSMNGTTGVGQRLNDLAGNPIPRNVIAGLTNPGQAGGNLLQRGTDALFGVNRQEYNPDLAAAHALGFVADQMGLDKYAAERAYYAPQTPQDIALGKQLHDAVNVRLDTQAMGKIAPLQANAAQSAMEAKGIYAPKNEKGFMLDMPIGAGGFTGKDLLNQPGNYYDTLDKITAAKAQYGDKSPQVRALEGELAKIRAADVQQAPGPLGQYFDTLNKENLAKYGDQTFRGKLNPQEQNAYDAFNDLKRSPDYKARTALEQQAAEANKGKDAPRGSAERNAYSDFYKQHGDELTRLNNIVNAAEQSIVDRFGVNPKELSNRASVAAGYNPVYTDTTIKGQQPIGQAGAPSTSNASSNTSGRGGSNPSSSNRPTSTRNNQTYGSTGNRTGSAGSQSAGNAFFDLLKTVTDKREKAIVLDALDRAGVNPIGQRGVTAETFQRALAVAHDALNTKRAADQIDAGRRTGGNQSSSRALSLAELSALMQRTTGIGPAAGDRAMLGGGYSAPAPTRTTQPTRTYNLPYPGKKKAAA